MFSNIYVTITVYLKIMGIHKNAMNEKVNVRQSIYQIHLQLDLLSWLFCPHISVPPNKSLSESSKLALGPCCDHYLIESYRECPSSSTVLGN